jgi:hypothetical protein
VDLSGLIFVALAVAWAAYLIPKALRHHEDVVRGRSIDRFSRSMRVLARREPVSARMARLVVTPSSGAGVPAPAAATPAPEEQYAARRAATRTATKRRRRVLALLLLVLLGVVAACAGHRAAWPFVALPAGLLLAWLVACRLMVRKELAWRPLVAPENDEEHRIAPEVAGEAAPEARPSARDPELWDPVPVTLPTYVSKPPARRSVRTIDLDSTGVWTSGRTEADSALAREAEATERARRRASRKADAGDEAVGS